MNHHGATQATEEKASKTLSALCASVVFFLRFADFQYTHSAGYSRSNRAIASARLRAES